MIFEDAEYIMSNWPDKDDYIVYGLTFLDTKGCVTEKELDSEWERASLLVKASTLTIKK